MKYTILGFQQIKLMEHGLNTDDALILSVIRDMYSSKKMDYKIIEDDRFIWVEQGYLLEQIPIIGSRRTLLRRLKVYEELGLIERRKVFNKGNMKGTFLYVNTTEKLEMLTEYESEGYDKVSQGVCQSDTRGMTKCHTKDSSIKDSSIKDINIYSRVIDYLNKKANTNYRSTTKKTQQIIKARINEGFKEEDFYLVIDKKVSEWINNKDMCRYLRPETLFGTKFESYLNQKVGEINGTNRIYGTGQNIESSRNKGNKSYFSKVKSEDELTDEERAAREELE